MAIFREKFRSYTLTLAEECEDEMARELARLSPAELEAFIAAYEDPGVAGAFASLEYDREMVGIEQWLEDDYYMGAVAKNMYGVWKTDLIELFQSHNYSQAILTGSTGCLAAGHLVQMADGRLCPVDSLQGATDTVTLFDQHLIAIGKATGLKATILVKFGHGFEVRCTPDHKFMTQDGWVEAQHLDSSKHRVRTPRTIRTLASVFSVSKEEAEWLGMMTADGQCRQSHGNSFHKADEGVLKRFIALCNSLGITWVEERTNSKASKIACHSESYKIIDRHGMRGHRSWEKRVSDLIAASPNDVVAAYIRGIFLDASWAIDKKTKAGKRAVYGVTLSLGNEVLIKQVWHLLKRFGIRARIFSSHSGRENERTMWAVEIRGIPNLLAFDRAMDGCPIDGHSDRWNAMVADLKTMASNTNVDLLPLTWEEAGFWVKSHGVKRPAGSRWGQWCSSKMAKNRRVSHQAMEAFFIDYPEMIRHGHEVYFDKEVFWESVESVVHDGLEVETYDLVVPNGNAYLVDGVKTHNTGKSYFSHLVVLRMIYEASCLKDPARSYGLSSGSIIGFCTIASSKETARRVVFEGISSKMKESPYFQYDFPPRRETKDETVFGKGLTIVAGSSTDTSIIGMNIFGGCMDEGNFMRTSNVTSSSHTASSQQRSRNLAKATRLYTSIVRRMKSRFNNQGKLPGILCVLSSKTTHDSFTEEIIKKALADGDRSMFIKDRSLIDVKRDQFSKETFKILVGTEAYPSRILPEGEDLKQYGRKALIIDVPEDLRKDFELNMSESLRDLLGVSTMAISSFMQRVDLVEKMKDPGRTHPFMCALMPNTLEWDSHLPYSVQWTKIARQRQNGEWEPILNPEAPRAVGLDPASTGDAFGLCIGHISHMVQATPGSNGDHNGILELQPFFVVDFVLRIQGHPGEEVIFKNVRNLLYQFSEHGFHLAKITSDTYQSREMISALKDQGYTAEILSVDTSKEPYRFLRSTIYDQRIKCYDYPHLFMELKNLEDTPLKIDHRATGCFVGTTRIPLLDGTFPMISELDGREVWVYSCDSTGQIVPGKARGRKTKMVKILLDVMLDSGAVVRCTPEHPWMMRNGSYKQAKDLRPGIDRLMPLRQYWPCNGGYEKITNSKGKASEVLTHHMVVKHFQGPIPKGMIVHHKNRNKTDNRPENLKIESNVHHSRHHTSLRHKTDKPWRDKLYAGAQAFNLSAEGRKKHSEAFRKTMLGLSPIEFRRRAELRIFFRRDITIEGLIAAANAGSRNANQASFFLKCGRNVIMRVLRDHGFATWDAFVIEKAGENHKVRALMPVVLDEEVAVFDLEVDDWHNFALAAGVFVHNSKDLADALAAAVWTLAQDFNSQRPILPEKGLRDQVMDPRTAAAYDQGRAMWEGEERMEAEVQRDVEKAKDEIMDGPTGAKVYVKKNPPKSTAPAYKKRNIDGSVEELSKGGATPNDIEDLLVRG